MAVIHEYIVSLVKSQAASAAASVLDYGCGAGEVVAEGIREGFDTYGVDVFYDGGSFREHARNTGMFGQRIFEMRDGLIPFDDARFDVVVSNQVFEHIDDFTLPLREITRVLRPGGVFINLFPSIVVWREGHIGIPFAHWFGKTSIWRFPYTLALRRLGAGYNKGSYDPSSWAKVNLDWIDKWTFYKPKDRVLRLFREEFNVVDFAQDYFCYRMRRHPRLHFLAGMFELPLARGVASFLCQRLAGHVFVLRKRVR